MTGTPHTELFDLLLDRHTSRILRIVHRDTTRSSIKLWGRDIDGGLHEIPEADVRNGNWVVDAASYLMPQDPSRILGCLLAGAAGDALGAAVEFMSWEDIQQEFGPAGIRVMAPAYGRRGAITDDTQMMLFTAEGLLRAVVRWEARGICHPPSVVHHALLRWLLTQGHTPATEVGRDGWLIQEPRLWSRRAPGTTCINALSLSRRFGEPAENNSKGCGGVMRVAACAFLGGNAFDLASESTRMSHGHPTGYLAAGLFADILERLWLYQLSLEQACVAALEAHGNKDGMEETRLQVEAVLGYHRQGVRPTPVNIAQLGGGWVADEALAIGLWCALSAKSLENGIVMAVNHGGDSDSTGMIAGNLLGLIHGPQAIPAHWLAELELVDVITRIAADISFVPGAYSSLDDSSVSWAIWQRYPGW